MSALPITKPDLGDLLLDPGLYSAAYLRLGMFNIQRVADLGCGDGPFVNVLTERAQRKEVYWGVDHDLLKVESARKRHPGWNFAFGDILQPNIQAEFPKYDAYLMIEVLDYLDDDLGFMASFASGAPMVFSVAGYEQPGVARWFAQQTDIQDRYSGLLRIEFQGRVRNRQGRLWHMVSGRRW